MELATATGALAALSVEMAGQIMVIDVLPGSSPHRAARSCPASDPRCQAGRQGYEWPGP